MAVYRSHPSEYDPPMLVLYRRLFALVKTAPSESTLIRHVVDGLQDFFDVERVSLSKLNKQGIAEVQYCRQGKEGSLPIGSLFDTSCVPRFQENMWAGRIVVTEEDRKSTRLNSSH